MSELEAQKTDALRTAFVRPEDCVFFTSDTGFLGVTMNGERHDRVILTRALPFTQPDGYLCISDVNKKELGIIERADAFTEDQQKLIRDELSLRYYCPEVTQILSIKEKMGHFYFEVMIGAQKKSFTVRDISKSIRMHGKEVEITDMDANRYRIRDFAGIPAKSRRMLEPYIY